MLCDRSISNLRERFEKELTSNSNHYHPIDIDRVRNEKFQVKRFLQDNDYNEDRAFKALIASLRWKKEFGIHDRTDQYFPKEFWEVCHAEIHGYDQEGGLVHWALARYIHTFRETTLLDKQFSAHLIERMDRLAGERQFTIVADANGVGLSNVNIELCIFRVTIFVHYPISCRRCIVVDLPKFLNSMLPMFIRMVGTKVCQILKFIQRQELTQFIDSQYITVSLGGTRNKNYFPSDTIPLAELGHKLGFSDKFIDQYYNYFKIHRIPTTKAPIRQISNESYKNKHQSA